MQTDSITEVYLLEEGHSDSMAAPVTKGVALYKHIAEYWKRSLPKDDWQYRTYKKVPLIEYVKPLY